MATDELQFRSWGFELYVPPTPFAKPPAPTRFVMLDDINGIFYDIDYETSLLGNQTSWSNLALHTVPRPAIVFAPEQQDMLQKMSFATGLLVSIDTWTSTLITARKLGRVNIKPLPKEFMNWGALRSAKGKELPAEMRAGLLRNVWNRRTGAPSQPIAYVTPGRVLNGMSRPWHRDGGVLNDELDNQFVGGKAIGPPSVWKVSGLDSEQIQKSVTRAALFIVK